MQLKNLLTLRSQVYNTFIDDEQYERITEYLSEYSNIEKSENLESKYAVYTEILAKLHIKKGEFEKAKQLYKNGIFEASHVPHQLIKILDEYSKAGLWEDGLQTLKEFYAEYPEILTNHQHCNLKYSDRNADTNQTAIDWAQDPKELTLLNLTPKEIHEYFQQKKQACLEKDILKGQSQGGPELWHIDRNTTYNSNTSDHFFPINGKEGFYAAIGNKVLKKLDNSLLSQFTSALEKGEITKKTHNNGIKFIAHKLIEVKINDDMRLYTDTIYKNENGKYIIVFNKLGNHLDVSKAAQNSKLKVLKTSSINQIFFATNENSDEQNFVQDLKEANNELDVEIELNGEVAEITEESFM